MPYNIHIINIVYLVYVIASSAFKDCVVNVCNARSSNKCTSSTTQYATLSTALRLHIALRFLNVYADNHHKSVLLCWFYSINTIAGKLFGYSLK